MGKEVEQGLMRVGGWTVLSVDRFLGDWMKGMGQLSALNLQSWTGEVGQVIYTNWVGESHKESSWTPGTIAYIILGLSFFNVFTWFHLFTLVVLKRSRVADAILLQFGDRSRALKWPALASLCFWSLFLEKGGTRVPLIGSCHALSPTPKPCHTLIPTLQWQSQPPS